MNAECKVQSAELRVATNTHPKNCVGDAPCGVPVVANGTRRARKNTVRTTVFYYLIFL